ncbi:FAD-dependent oxidoreductase, partial [Microbacterium sp. K41]
MNVVVVGAGIAGMTAALHAHEAGHTVTLVTKGEVGEGCTPLAQGGIAGGYGPDDSPAAHADDTLTAGAGL